MSTTLDLYLEKKLKNNAYVNITNQNVFDGAQLVNFNNTNLLPAFSYPCDHTFIRHLQKWGLLIHTIDPNQLSINSQIIYKQLSQQVTGKNRGLKAHTITFADLVQGYADHTGLQPIDATEPEMQFTQELLARIANAYYWQLGIAGDPTLLLPDNTHQPKPTPNHWNDFRLVGWIDA